MQNSADDTSWWDELINGLTQKQVQPPPAPQPPPVNQAAWEKSVEQAKISDSLGQCTTWGSGYIPRAIRPRRSPGSTPTRISQAAKLLFDNDILGGFDAAELHFSPALRRKRTNIEIGEDAMAVN